MSKAMKPLVKKHDVHLICNDWESAGRYIGEAKLYDHNGVLIWKIPCLCKGVYGPGIAVRGGDTPPGLYKAGLVTPTTKADGKAVWHAYGRFFIDMVEMQNQEAGIGRAGIGLHGGGTGLPDPLADYQQLIPTLGCVRVHNKDLERLIIPALTIVRGNGGTFWITVNQF